MNLDVEKDEEECQPLVLTDKQVKQLTSKIFDNQDPHSWVRRQLDLMLTSSNNNKRRKATTTFSMATDGFDLSYDSDEQDSAEEGGVDAKLPGGMNDVHIDEDLSFLSSGTTGSHNSHNHEDLGDPTNGTGGIGNQSEEIRMLKSAVRNLRADNDSVRADIKVSVEIPTDCAGAAHLLTKELKEVLVDTYDPQIANPYFPSDFGFKILYSDTYKSKLVVPYVD